MKTRYKAKNFKAKIGLAKFLKDTAGSMAMVWGVIGIGVVMMVGAAYDVNQVSKAKAIAQMAADNMALTASIAVDTNNDDRYIDDDSYPYIELGGPANDFTNSMTGVVNYDVPDLTDQSRDANGNLKFDESGAPVYEKLIATATVSGTYTPAFISALGVAAIPFSATSDVSYSASEGSPASIFFVVDNSGSMGSTDGDGIVKLTSLENSMTNFMGQLSPYAQNGDKIIRTAMFPYSADPLYRHNGINSNGRIPSDEVDPDWGTISNHKITDMVDRAGTDSSGALQRAANKLDLENAIHADPDDGSGDENPLKFAIFMTDGANNYTCEGGFYGKINGPFWYHWYGNNRLAISRQYEAGNPRYKGDYHTPNNSSSSWRYFSGNRTRNKYNYCIKDLHFDARSLDACDQMKNENGPEEDQVKVYAIAYDVAQSEQARARDFLEQCSSGPEYYKQASNAAALEEVFAQIGEEIVSEVIRVKR